MLGYDIENLGDEINTVYVFYAYTSSFYVLIPLVMTHSNVLSYDMRYMNNRKFMWGAGRCEAMGSYTVYNLL